jgi:hypothetical protein
MKTAIASLLLLVILRPEIQERTDAADDIAALLTRKIAAREANEAYSVEISGREAKLLLDRFRAMRLDDHAARLALGIECCSNRVGGLYLSVNEAKEMRWLVTEKD